MSIKQKLQKTACWPELEALIHKIHQNGFQVLIVGGAVRQALLNKKIEELDLASSAKPDELLKLFPKAKGTFKKYAVVLIPLKNKKTIEITSFRKDSKQSDGRRPRFIEYSGIKEDASRRDFTINALFYDLQKDQVMDWFGGIKDLETKTIRCIGKAEERFKEDHLRVLRALRLSRQLNFKIESQTQKALLKWSQSVEKLSKERILKELNKMFSSGNFYSSISLLRQNALFKTLFPTLELLKTPVSFPPEQKIFRFWKQRFSFYQDTAFCWTLLGLPFFYKDKKSFQNFLKTYPLSSSIQKQSSAYWLCVHTLIHSDFSFTEKLLAFNKKPKEVYELTKALIESQIIKSSNLKNLDFYFKEFKKRERSNKLPPALVTGHDLLGFESSIKKTNFSKWLKQAYALQMENPSWNKLKILKNLKF